MPRQRTTSRTTKTNGSLSAPSSATSGGNGVYTYSASTAFPTAGNQATNYWVDVVLERSSINSVPIAGNDNGFTVSNSGLLSIASAALLANDSDPDGDPSDDHKREQRREWHCIAEQPDRFHYLHADFRLYRTGELLLRTIGWPRRHCDGRSQRDRGTIRYDSESFLAVQRTQHSFHERSCIRGTGREVPGIIARHHNRLALLQERSGCWNTHGVVVDEHRHAARQCDVYQ